MRVLALTALLVPLALSADGCECEDCGGFLLPVRTAYVRVTVRDSTGAGILNVRITVTTSRNSVSVDSTDLTGLAVVTQHMYASPESATVTLAPAGGALVGMQLRVRLQDPDTTSITAILRVP